MTVLDFLDHDLYVSNATYIKEEYFQVLVCKNVFYFDTEPSFCHHIDFRLLNNNWYHFVCLKFVHWDVHFYFVRPNKNQRYSR